MKKSLVVFLCKLALASLVLLAGISCKPVVDPIVDPVVSGRKEVLKKLGLPVDESAPTNANGIPVTGDENPLGKKISKFFIQNELFLAGANIAASGSVPALGRYSVVESDKDGTLTEIAKFSEADSAAWLLLPKKSVAADINRDGKDEIVTAVFNGPAKTIQFKYTDASGAMQTKLLEAQTFMTDFGASPRTANNSWFTDEIFMRDFESADFNNDGNPEFVLSCFKQVLILDTAFTVIGSFEVEDNEAKAPYVRIAAGDLNGDEYADLVLVNGRSVRVDINNVNSNYSKPSKYFIFAGGPAGLGIPVGAANLTNYAKLSGVLSGESTTYCSGEVALADYNGDGLNELVFAGIKADSGFDYDYYAAFDAGWARLTRGISILDPFNETSKAWIMTYPVKDLSLGELRAYSYNSLYPRNLYVPRIAVGRFDGGKKDMFLVIDKIYKINDSKELVPWDNQPYSSSGSFFNGMLYDQAVAGDITGDGAADLIYFTYDQMPYYTAGGPEDKGMNRINSLVIWGKDSGGAYKALQTIPVTSSNEYPSLALANVDDDSLVVEYDHFTQSYSDPKILTVLASPPYNAAMDISNSSTSYSLSTGTTVSNSGRLGFYVGGSLGVTGSWDAVLGGATGASWGFDVRATTQADFSWGWGFEEATEDSKTYTVNAGSDQVIFSGFPIDTYVYKILSAPAAYIAENGLFVTINIPRKPEAASMELSAYNAIVEEKYRIPATLINHTLGNPYTYYSAAQKAALQTEGAGKGGYMFSNSTMPVAQGSAATGLSTSKTATKFDSFDFDLSIGVVAQFTLTYAVFSIEGGMTGGYSYEHSAGTGTTVEGVVGCIADAKVWGENKFNWGLMMVPKTFGDQKFSFVTYWVE